MNHDHRKSGPDVTDAVIEAFGRTEDPRLREILLALVRHLHGFVREVRLSEREFQEAARIIAALGQKTTPSHNEVVLDGGLARRLRAGLPAQQRRSRPDRNPGQPARAVLARRPADLRQRRYAGAIATPGPGLAVDVRVTDRDGRPVAGAEVDVWHSSPEGLYENQDPAQAEMNLRGRFMTDAAGRFHFRSVKPAGYPIPIDGPVGDLVRATRRHHYRPAHLHFMIYKPGFKTMISQIYSPDDEHLDSDVQFGVTRALIGDYRRHDEPSTDGFAAPWYSLDQRFVLEPGEARRPMAPIRAKAAV